MLCWRTYEVGREERHLDDSGGWLVVTGHGARERVLGGIVGEDIPFFQVPIQARITLQGLAAEATEQRSGLYAIK